GGAAENTFREGYAHLGGGGLVDDQIRAGGDLDGDIARIFTLQDTNHDLAGLLADIAVVEAQRGDSTARHGVGIGGEQRQLGLFGNADGSFEGRDDRVVGGDVDHVGAIDEGAG